MKKFFCCIMALILSLSVVGCETTNVQTISEPEEKVFAYGLPEWLLWGMKEGEVRQHIAHEKILEYGNLIYIVKDDYKKCRVSEYYGFADDNALIHMSYTFNYSNVIYDEPNPYHDLYNEFKNELIQLYGEPAGEHEEWKDERYKDDEYMLYKAIEDGDYTATTAWDLDGFICYIELNEGLSITYEAKKE